MTPPTNLDIHLTGSPVAEMVSGLQRTTVHADPDGTTFWWVHRPGLQRTDDLVPGAAAESLRPVSATPEGAAIALAVQYDDALVHRASGPHSAASWLRDFRPAARTLVAHAVSASGTALRQVHAAPLPHGTVPGTPGLARLLRWLSPDTALPAGAARLRTMAHARWGDRRTALLHGWVRAALGDQDTRRLVHGWASLGQVVPPLSSGPVAVLTGEDVGCGRPELDLGWMLGDLAEVGWFQPELDSVAPATQALAKVLLAGYGARVDRTLLGWCAALRFVTHMQDYATFRPWHDELDSYLEFATHLIDDEGTLAVPQEAP